MDTTSEQEKVDVSQLTDGARKKIFLEERLKVLSKPYPIRKMVWGTVGTCLVVTATVAGFMYPEGWSRGNTWILLATPFGTALYIALLLWFSSYVRSSARSRLERELATVITTGRSEELQEKLEENFFTNLVKINFKYIDQYYLQTQVQADKSFSLCTFAAVISLLVIIVGIVMLFVNQSDKAAGYVATAAGTLGEFIAAVFFYLYNRTITKMGEYHQKLVLTQNVSIALKLSEELPATEQVIARMKLIDYLSKDINLLLATNHSAAEMPGKLPQAQS